MADELKENLMKTSKNDFFTYLEEYVKYPVPELIKNILIFNGYDTAISLSKLDEDSLNEIETTMRNVFNASLIPETDSLQAYVGVFHKNFKQFVLFSGQKRFIKTLAEACYKFCNPETSPAAIAGNSPNRGTNSAIHFQHSVEIIPLLFKDHNL